MLLAPVDRPLEEDRHDDPFAGGVADAFQRNPHFDRVALVVDPAGAVPDHVHAEIFLVAGEPAVPLDAQGIDVEGVEGLLVVERVQVDADEVVVYDVVPPGDRGLDLVRLVVETAEGEIEVLPVVGHDRDGLFGLLLPHDRDEDLEIRDARGFRPDGIIQEAVDHGGAVGLERLEESLRRFILIPRSGKRNGQGYDEEKGKNSFRHGRYSPWSIRNVQPKCFPAGRYS